MIFEARETLFFHSCHNIVPRHEKHCSPECRSLLFCKYVKSKPSASNFMPMGARRWKAASDKFVFRLHETGSPNRLWDTVEDMTTPCFPPGTLLENFKLSLSLSPSLLSVGPTKQAGPMFGCVPLCTQTLPQHINWIQSTPNVSFSLSLWSIIAPTYDFVLLVRPQTLKNILTSYMVEETRRNSITFTRTLQ